VFVYIIFTSIHSISNPHFQPQAFILYAYIFSLRDLTAVDIHLCSIFCYGFCFLLSFEFTFKIRILSTDVCKPFFILSLALTFQLRVNVLL